MEHNCHELMKDVKKRMTTEMNDYIFELFEKGTLTVKSVLAHITAEKSKGTSLLHDEVPNKRQIEYLLRKFRNKIVAPLFKLGDLMMWCNEHSIFPNNDDEVFVLGQECSALYEKMMFRFVLTTPELLRRASKFETICIDTVAQKPIC